MADDNGKQCPVCGGPTISYEAPSPFPIHDQTQVHTWTVCERCGFIHADFGELDLGLVRSTPLHHPENELTLFESEDPTDG